MEYRELGNSGIKVSVICLGSMTYGEQNTADEAHEQLDYALAAGVNFIDTAEIRPRYTLRRYLPKHRAIRKVSSGIGLKNASAETILC